ncbi:WEB family protein At4g27595, chloroplastic-like [Hibiscus syriacus]|uniref:WEB family protein At4g27595, chloroplastic-like n=1 Tax=Hibiscus syriacus TaxID=106335 RepID=UPI001923E463|nr:WEB family protein At4g27595, chloroplastic-like [Hibiscus syriacus]
MGQLEEDSSLSFAKEEQRVEKSEAMDLLLLEGKRRIHELEDEIKRRDESEKKMYDSLVAQTKELAKTKISIEESRQEITSLREILEKMEGSSEAAASQSSSSLDSLEAELQSAKEKEGNVASLKAKMNSLKNEMKSTREAKENNLRVLDDLALALKEVRTEAIETKEEASMIKDELEKSKDEVENLKLKLKNIEVMYNEAKNEAETFKYISEILTLEAEQNLMQWDMKETGFVDCIKKLEDEKNAAQEENKILLESLTEAQNMYRKAMEENEELRDNKKQAVYEANYVTKETASIYSRNKEGSNKLSPENENRKSNGSATFEIIREWKLCFVKSKEVEDETKNLIKESDEESESDLSDPPRGSIFDVVETLEHQKKPAFVAIDEAMNNSEEFYHLGTGHFYVENNKTSRKKKALLSRFSDLLKIRTLH